MWLNTRPCAKTSKQQTAKLVPYNECYVCLCVWVCVEVRTSDRSGSDSWRVLGKAAPRNSHKQSLARRRLEPDNRPGERYTPLVRERERAQPMHDNGATYQVAPNCNRNRANTYILT